MMNNLESTSFMMGTNGEEVIIKLGQNFLLFFISGAIVMGNSREEARERLKLLDRTKNFSDF